MFQTGTRRLDDEAPSCRRLSVISHNLSFIQNAPEAQNLVAAAGTGFQMPFKKIFHFGAQALAMNFIAKQVEEQLLADCFLRKLHNDSLLVGQV